MNLHMKILAWVLGVILVLLAILYAFMSYIDKEKQDTMADVSQNSAVRVIPIEHASGILDWGGDVIYFDPTGGAEAYEGQSAASIVLITDIHGDHLSSETIEAVLGDAVLIVPQAVKDELPEALASRATVMSNGESMDVAGYSIQATPMYNLPDADNADRHTKGRGNGYIVEKEGTRVLIAGDTAGTPELRSLRDIDIALVPMNLPYTMGVDEAADAVLDFKPKTVYPYHYRTPDGLSDVQRFKQLVNAGDPSLEVVLAPWYGSSN